MKKINAFIEQHILFFLFFFLLSQPFIDVLTSFVLRELTIPFTIGIIFRIGFLLFLIYYFFFVYKGNKLKIEKYLLFFLTYAFLFLGYSFLSKGTQSLFQETQGLFRSFYFPLLLVFCYPILHTKKESLPKNSILYIIIPYVLMVAIPTIFNFGFGAYTEGKVGNLGWFYSTNEVSAILSIFLPFLALYFLEKERNLKNILFGLICLLLVFFSLFTLGTKMTIVSLGITLLILGIYYGLKLISEKRYRTLSIASALIIIFFGIGLYLLPKTSFYQNIQIHLDYLGVTDVSQIVTDPKVIDHFIFSSRLSFLSERNQEYRIATPVERGLGLGYVDKDDFRNPVKLVEMDFFDIFYCHGILGFILYFLPLFGFLKQEKIFTSKRKDFKEVMYRLSIFLVFFIALFVGHVLVAPAVSIWVVFILLEKDALLQTV